MEGDVGMSELLFYGGAVLFVLSIAALIIYTCISQKKKKHIKEQLNSEYGEAEKE